ncbi:MAG: polysaccharide biosynthesis protein PslG [Solirubrobacteraceae bacterium]|nr:polysaccharide biosynthesis protein PslG [Solirubrobacteraceae bacterium]
MRFLLVLLALAFPAGAAAAPVLGVYSDDERGGAPLQQAAVGFQSVRQAWAWRTIEPHRGEFDWSATDAAVRDAGRHGLTILPFLLDPPAWAAATHDQGMSPPRRVADFAAFAAAAVRRYGRHGTFRDGRPIRVWQIWNEPNLVTFLRPEPDAAGYVKLLRAAARRIHAVDRGATVLAAGLPDSASGVPQATYLRRLYAAGLRGAADALAIHAYAPDVVGVLALVSRTRALMRTHGDWATPLWITEYGFATAGEDSLFTVSERDQAAYIGATAWSLRALAGRLRLGGLFLFGWRDPAEHFLGVDIWPYHAGLLTADGEFKPSIQTLTNALGAPVSDLPVRPFRLKLRAQLKGRRLRVRCSARCTLGAVLVHRIPREGRVPTLRVNGRWSQRLPARRWRTIRVLGPGTRVEVSAITASGAAARRTLELRDG